MVTAFVTTRALGIGPAASLMGKGSFGERETVVVADFRPPADDSLIGSTVAEALRTDLAQSANLAVLTRATVRDILDRMQRPRESVVYFPLAREIATREGARAVVDGEIVRLGSSYVISARLVSSIDGAELATFRETAQDEAALVPSVGALSRSIRERVGESLKGIRRTAPLERVTTSSLPALRKYVEATRLQGTTGEEARALELLEEAVALDSTFAMAWRRIAVIINNASGGNERSRTAIETAMRFRDRLSDEERAFTEAYYYTRGPEPDYGKAAAAYEEVLRRDSTNSTALNNLSVNYQDLRRFEESAELLKRSLTTATATGSNYTNSLLVLTALRDTAGIDSVAALFAANLPDNNALWEARSLQAYVRGQLDSSVAEARVLARAPQSGRQAYVSNGLMADWSVRRGRAGDAMRYLRELRRATVGDVGTPVTTTLLRADSAFMHVFLRGDPREAAAVVRRALAPDLIASLAPPDRQWLPILAASAYAGDSASARVAHAGYVTDLSERSPMRTFSDARANAYLAIANEQHDEAIAQLRVAIAERASPEHEEAFLMAMSHERAGRPDSAIVWLQRTLSAPSVGFGDGLFLPAAKRRLGELYDAKGDLRRAIQYYEAFLDEWNQPEPEQEAVVRDVKARVAALRARLSPG